MRPAMTFVIVTVIALGAAISEYSFRAERGSNPSFPYGRASRFRFFSKFQHSLSRHIAFEESHLLPKYAQEGGEVAGGTLAIFQAEHRKLLEMMDKLAKDCMALFAAADLDGQIIVILDQETLFKGLLSDEEDKEKRSLHI